MVAHLFIQYTFIHLLHVPGTALQGDTIINNIKTISGYWKDGGRLKHGLCRQVMLSLSGKAVVENERELGNYKRAEAPRAQLRLETRNL